MLCYGVPLRIGEEPKLTEPGEDKLPAQLRRNGAAVDSELCAAAFDQSAADAGRLLAQSAFTARPMPRWFDPPTAFSWSRGWTGPRAEIARGLVDKAMEAETNGLWGRAYFDLRGLTD